MLPIYLWWDKEVNEGKIEIAKNSINEALQEGIDVSRYFPLKVIGSGWHEGDFGSVEWYLENTRKRVRDYGTQYNVSDILNLCSREPHQKLQPHIEFGILSKDLYSENLNFVYGETLTLNPSYSKVGSVPAGCVVSLFRQELWFKEKSSLTLGKTCVHELAHIFHVPWRKENVEHSLGCHCVRGDCVMGQSNVTRKILWEEERKIETRFITSLEIAEKVLERKKKTGSSFCQDCLEDIVKAKKAWVYQFFKEEI
ncbi:MAG: hypothetical protein QMD14_03055 [Candidatus Aenigmarchaeota archaeon]|nr:hypothetical protein [Candidatus Aenigmarchaeota archaeon]